jgi:hypothetical protein
MRIPTNDLTWNVWQWPAPAFPSTVLINTWPNPVNIYPPALSIPYTVLDTTRYVSIYPPHALYDPASSDAFLVPPHPAPITTDLTCAHVIPITAKCVATSKNTVYLRTACPNILINPTSLETYPFTDTYVAWPAIAAVVRATYIFSIDPDSSCDNGLANPAHPHADAFFIGNTRTLIPVTYRTDSPYGGLFVPTTSSTYILRLTAESEFDEFVYSFSSNQNTSLVGHFLLDYIVTHTPIHTPVSSSSTNSHATLIAILAFIPFMCIILFICFGCFFYFYFGYKRRVNKIPADPRKAIHEAIGLSIP